MAGPKGQPSGSRGSRHSPTKPTSTWQPGPAAKKSPSSPAKTGASTKGLHPTHTTIASLSRLPDSSPSVKPAPGTPAPGTASDAPAGTPSSTPGAEPEGDPAARKHSPGATAWTVVLIADLVIVGALFAVGAYCYALPCPFLEAGATDGEAAPPGAGDIVANSTFILVMVGVIPFLWVLGTRVVPWAGTVRYLGLERPLERLGKGALWGLALVGLIVVLAFALERADQSLGTNSTENPQLEALLAVITWPLAFYIAFAAAVAEEILFRGILQKWIGLWGQAIVFGLAHASYGTPLQVIIPFAIGILFGWFVRRGHGILLPMAAHFVYDFTVASSPLWLEG